MGSLSAAEVPELALQELAGLPSTEWLITPSARAELARMGIRPTVSQLSEITATSEQLVVVGGGTIIDEAKFWRTHEQPSLRLFIVPSIWGSGAEVSPVVVRNRDGAKVISLGDEYLPSGRAYCNSLGLSAPREMRLAGTGDAISHALEAFYSPVAAPSVRAAAADLLRVMTSNVSADDAAWFGLSAHACALQARASVGLVHGIAHQIEGHTSLSIGHAAICQTLLQPVLAFNLESSAKLRDLLVTFDVDIVALQALCASLFDQSRYNELRATISTRWDSILRDPCTRTNVALVRRSSAAFFVDFMIHD